MVKLETSSETQESLEMTIKSGSYTRLSKFESCKFQAKLAYIDKIPEPERPLPPGKTEHANDRGTRIHEAAEKYIKGGVELIPELQKFSKEFEKARQLYAEGKASTEGDWAFTRAWESVAWMSSDVWLRVKLDVSARLTKKSGMAIDIKSGKKFGNEIKHNEQMQLYTIAMFVKFPELEQVVTELWYVDLDDISSVTYTRDQGLRFVPNYERRMDLMTSCIDFPPNPNFHVCRWCPYKPTEKGGSGHCKVGI